MVDLPSEPTPIRLLLRLLGSTTSDNLDWPEPANWDWRQFAAACDHHHVAPFVHCRLKELGSLRVPTGLLEWLRARFYDVSGRNYWLANKLVELTSMLEDRGIPVLGFKGPSLAMAVYGDLTRRQYSDLDLVVGKEHLLKAVEAMRHAGFLLEPIVCRPRIIPCRALPDNPRHLAAAREITFRAPDNTYFIDVHWELEHGRSRLFSPEPGHLWERTQQVALPIGRVSTFCREDLFLALCFHGTKHRWFRLKWLLDVAEMLGRPEPFDWSRIEEMTTVRPGVGPPAGVALLLARELLGAPIPAGSERVLPVTKRTFAVAAAIREEILERGHTRESDHPATLWELEDRSWVRMRDAVARAVYYPSGLFAEIFLEISPKDRALISLPTRVGLLYHVVRPGRLVAEHGIRAAGSFWSLVRRTIARAG